ncbi:MAG: UDP-N-acetylmuramoyl-L-alanyl-D-glutamate--2,6-diaminopimelate ligase, partial [Desulfobulbaceae bacterium]|nr:UDP-N-acetylmuramoyl-L-alanyl-D-glutamate--2,6-diaminopimelate ligase [Desulfobulbaceae bacterium]
IGITGTNGKTTTSAILENILTLTGQNPGVIGTIDCHYRDPEDTKITAPSTLTTPDPLTLHRVLREMVDNRVTHVIIEASSHALIQQRLIGLNFQAVVFTNLSRDHLDYHDSMEEYYQAKKLLFTDYLTKDGFALIVSQSQNDQPPMSPDYSLRLTQELHDKDIDPNRIITCGFTPDCDLYTNYQTTSLNGSSITFNWRGTQYPTSSPLTGRYNILNLLAACGSAICLNIDPLHVFNTLRKGDQVAGRLEKIILPNPSLAPFSPLVMVDYAHTPDALENVLRTLKDITSGRLICLFGCGGDRDHGKRKLMGAISGRLADLTIITNDNPRSEPPLSILQEIETGLLNVKRRQLKVADLLSPSSSKQGYLLIEDRQRAIHTVCSLANPEDVILIAGKGHETYQIQNGHKSFFDDRLEARNGLLTWNKRHLVQATGGKITHGSQQEALGNITTDTRAIEPAQIFLALKGDNFDGHDYLESAVAKGAKVIITEKIFDPGKNNVIVLLVKDTLQALGDLAAYRRKLLENSLRVIGITGSCGKTTVKEMTAAILAQHFRVPPGHPDPILKTAGNFNNLIGLPLTLLRLQAHHRVVVLEMGMNKPGEIARLTEIANPDIGCITNVHAAHLEGLGDIKGVAHAKSELFDQMQHRSYRIINCDDPNLIHLTTKNTPNQIHFAVSDAADCPKPKIVAQTIENHGVEGLKFRLSYDNQPSDVALAMGGIHNISNCLAAAATCLAVPVPYSCIAPGLANFQPVDKRMETVYLTHTVRALNDCYNANPASMCAALNTVASFCPNPTIKAAALGDMLELGSDAPELHHKLGELVGELGYNFLALTGDFSDFVAKGAIRKGLNKNAIKIFANKDHMAVWFADLINDNILPPGSWLLVKGSRGMRMELMLSHLKELLAQETIET